MEVNLMSVLNSCMISGMVCLLMLEYRMFRNFVVLVIKFIDLMLLNWFWM